METLPVESAKMPILEHEPKEVIDKVVEVANLLKDVVIKAGLAKKFGGDKEHLFYEAWQTVGGFFSHSVKTLDAVPVEVEGVKGAKARAILYDRDGKEIGGAEAYCMRDERNWKDKPFFQLSSMAQTRAGSKAFRNKFSWVATLGGYAGTPAEEMDGVDESRSKPKEEATHKTKDESKSNDLISDPQRKRFYAIAKTTGASDEQIKEWLMREYGYENTKDITRADYDDICNAVKEELSQPGKEG